MPEVNGHSSARLRSSVVFPLPDGPVTTNVSPTSRRMSSGLIELLAVGGADLDVVELNRAVDAWRGRHLRQRPAFFVGDDQAVQTDDRGPVPGELVVGVAEERQPVLDAAECRRGLGHVRRA